jgi:hypothetical protein
MLSDNPATRELINLLHAALATIAVPDPVEEVRVYSFVEVADITGMSRDSLEQDCRAGRLEHTHRGRKRGMTLAQIRKLLDASTAARTAGAETTPRSGAYRPSRKSVR